MAIRTVAASFPTMRRHAKFLESLPARFQQNSVKKATTFATTPLLKAAENKAPEDSGALKESFIKVTRVYRRTGTVMSFIGIKKGFTRYYKGTAGAPKPQKPGKYLHLILFGTRHSRPNRFFSRAFTSAKPAMKQRFFAKMKKDLPKDVQRAKQKGAL